ncbi:hypothetical protein [Siminovitchia sp. 179-K 8D1 HS]|uniref:hypothetical protein n=1 Tax=Siminovitchia sp. 179-K 8D1 HS TaxID=3142385 RepID=UPI0039A2CDE3
MNGLASKVLFEGQADEYAEIINHNAICHEDCVEVLKAVAKLKNTGHSNESIINKLLRN